MFQVTAPGSTSRVQSTFTRTGPLEISCGAGAEHYRLYGTLKGTLLESVPPGVATSTMPVVAPVGTVVVIKDGEPR